MLEVAGRRGRRRDRARSPTQAAAEGIDVVDRHRRPRLVPARARPAHQGALQQARRLRLRALRRGRHLRAHRRHARAVPRVRGAARRHERQPARRARASARRPRPSWSRPTATSRGSSSTSTSCRRSSARTSARRATACSRTARCRVLRARRRRSTSSPTTSRRARSTASRCACCSTSSSSARCCRACSKRSATSREADAEADDARGRGRDRCATRRGRGAALAALAARGERVALEPRWDGAPGRSALARARDRRPATTRPTSTATLLARRRRCATALGALVGPDGPPLVAHRAKELMHGLGASTLRVARRTTPR